MADSDPKDVHFHSLKAIAHYFSTRGYNTTKSLTELHDSLFNECNVDRFTLGLAAGILADLWEISRGLDRQLNAIELNSDRTLRLLERWSESALKPPVDPIADACLLCWQGPGSGHRWNGTDWYANLDTKTVNILDVLGCDSPGELAAFGKRRLRAIRMCGATTVHKIEAFLRETYGLELAD
jgi:hypothetical protein